jgi:heptosyltransferase-1
LYAKMLDMPQILLVKTSSMGDVIHNLPIIADIRAHYPDAHFDWMVEESFAEIPRLHPLVSNTIPIAVRRWRKSLLHRNTWHEIAELKKRLSPTTYDLIIDTQGLLKSALLAQFAHGDIHGMDYHSAREPIASFFYKQKHHVAKQQHAVSRNRALAALALHYPIPTSAPDYGLAATSLQSLPLALPAHYVVGLHGTSRDSKLWPIAHWVVLAKHLKEAGLSLVLPWSNPAEEQRAKSIAEQASNALVLPKLKLTPLATILAHAQFNIGVDTGLMHLSTALDKPSIAIYTDTNPEYTGVMGGGNNAAINIGGKAQIPSAEDVFDLARKFISKDFINKDTP